MSNRGKKNRIACLTSAAGRLVKNQPAQISASDFCAFRVSDSPEACSSCDTTPARCPAPIVIKGEHYCLWCALEIARAILVGEN